LKTTIKDLLAQNQEKAIQLETLFQENKSLLAQVCEKGNRNESLSLVLNEVGDVYAA
jgi:hypothetical protein